MEFDDFIEKLKKKIDAYDEGYYTILNRVREIIDDLAEEYRVSQKELEEILKCKCNSFNICEECKKNGKRI